MQFLRIGEVGLRRVLLVGACDLATEIRESKLRGEPRSLDGFLGSDVFEHFRAVIDCGDRKLYLLPDLENVPNNVQAKLLQERGFVSVPMKRLGSGHLVVESVIQERQYLLVVGARLCCVDPNRTKALDLKWMVEETTQKGDDGLYAYLKQPQIGALTVKGSALVIRRDLSEFNAELKRHSEPQVDGLLGLNLLTYCSAIIDYANMRLYLRNPSKRQTEGMYCAPKTGPTKGVSYCIPSTERTDRFSTVNGSDATGYVLLRVPGDRLV